MSEPQKNKKNQYILIGFGALALICAVMIIPTFFVPRPPEPTYEETTEADKEVDTYRIELDSVQTRLTTLNKNLDKIYQNQIALQKSLDEIIQNQNQQNQTTQQNRTYINETNKRINDIELQIRVIGGGFNMKRKGTSDIPTSNIPKDAFP